MKINRKPISKYRTPYCDLAYGTPSHTFSAEIIIKRGWKKGLWRRREVLGSEWFMEVEGLVTGWPLVKVAIGDIFGNAILFFGIFGNVDRRFYLWGIGISRVYSFFLNLFVWWICVFLVCVLWAMLFVCLLCRMFMNWLHSFIDWSWVIYSAVSIWLKVLGKGY